MPNKLKEIIKEISYYGEMNDLQVDQAYQEIMGLMLSDGEVGNNLYESFKKTEEFKILAEDWVEVLIQNQAEAIETAQLKKLNGGD